MAGEKITLMVKKCAGLLGTTDINEWEQNFLEGVMERTRNGDDTTMLTDRQISVIARLYDKHYA